MNRKQIATAAALVVLAFGATWAMGFFSSGDPQLAELEQLRDENFEKMKNNELSDEERRQQFGDFREKVRELPEEQRRQFFESSRPMFLQMMNRRMDKFFTMPPEEQTQELDKMIDRMEERRSNRADNGGGRNRGGEQSPQQRDQRRKERLDRTTPEMRGKMDRFRDMVNERREQRGLDPMSGRGMFGSRGGPR